MMAEATAAFEKLPLLWDSEIFRIFCIAEFGQSIIKNERKTGKRERW